MAKERIIPQFPHCDPRILHAPNECEFCDQHSEWQELRKIWGIAFTGHSYDKNGKPAKDECGDTLQPRPAEADRGMESINGWGGNVAMTPEREKQIDADYARLGEEIRQHTDSEVYDSLEPAPDSDPIKHYADGTSYDFAARESSVTSSYAHGDKVTLSGKPADPTYDGGAPQPIDEATGMHKDYWVLSPEERAKGFVRPVRRTYKHVGDRPKFPLRDLTSEEQIRYAGCNYTKFEQYLEADGSSVSGRFWTEARLNSGCGTLTTMGDAIAETYARNPEFYGATFCCQCRDHFPVGEKGEFEWLDGGKVGT